MTQEKIESQGTPISIKILNILLKPSHLKKIKHKSRMVTTDLWSFKYFLYFKFTYFNRKEKKEELFPNPAIYIYIKTVIVSNQTKTARGRKSTVHSHL